MSCRELQLAKEFISRVDAGGSNACGIAVCWMRHSKRTSEKSTAEPQFPAPVDECRSEDLIGLRITDAYMFQLLSRICKVAERQRLPVSELLLERIATTLTDGTQNSDQVHLCFFYESRSVDWASPAKATCTQQSSGNVRIDRAAMPEHTSREGPCGGKQSDQFSCDWGRHVTKEMAFPADGWLVMAASNNMLAGGTGCHVWPAGLFLAEWILRHASFFRGQRCLELGCGTGSVGVALAHAGALQVWLPAPAATCSRPSAFAIPLVVSAQQER
jgi:ribosomal protein L11 methylase PrmA